MKVLSFVQFSCRTTVLIALFASALIACSSGSAANNGETPDVTEDASAPDSGGDSSVEPTMLRVATFNASMYRSQEGQLARELAGGSDEQAQSVAEVLQRVRPDVVLINEFDWDADGESARLFQEEYLERSQNGAEALDYAYRYVPETNTGIHSGVDLNNDGTVASTQGSQSYGNDAFGFGTFPGQYGFVIYSKFPIATDEIRTFRKFLWKDMPENLLPADWYSPDAIEVMRLSSKNHVDVPIDVGAEMIHLLASHPTPPSFDGDEDRNGRRNHDEIRFWRDYIAGGAQADYIRDDAGRSGGLTDRAEFVVLGDLNSDPRDGNSRHEAIQALIDSAHVNDVRPDSQGAQLAAERDGQVNESHTGEARLDTADFSDGRVGNLRVDYALPSAGLNSVAAGVFWPVPDAEFARLADVSDHRLVWVDLRIE